MVDFNLTVAENRKKLSRPLLAAHRGVCGANIPCNTLAAYKIAVEQGADVVEIDISKSSDGKYFVFHPGMEHVFLRTDKRLCELSADEIEKLRLCNSDGAPTHYKIPTLGEVLAFLKGKTYINVDKYWDDIQGITAEIRRIGVEKQVIVKTYAIESDWDKIEKYAPDLMYMTMAWHNDDVTERVLKKDINFIGIEALFDKESDPIASADYVASMHEKGLAVWEDAIVYDESQIISAGHTDDISLIDSPDKGWGWFLDRGVDFIQTDWLAECAKYLQKKSK